MCNVFQSTRSNAMAKLQSAQYLTYAQFYPNTVNMDAPCSEISSTKPSGSSKFGSSPSTFSPLRSSFFFLAMVKLHYRSYPTKLRNFSFFQRTKKFLFNCLKLIGAQFSGTLYRQIRLKEN